jgi:hypothetical protein
MADRFLWHSSSARISIVVRSGNACISNILVFFMYGINNRLEMTMKIVAIMVNGLLVAVHKCEH